MSVEWIIQYRFDIPGDTTERPWRTFDSQPKGTLEDVLDIGIGMLDMMSSMRSDLLLQLVNERTGEIIPLSAL